MSYKDRNEITDLFIKHIYKYYQIEHNIYSDNNINTQNKIINYFEECINKFNYNVNDISVNKIPLFAAINKFAHPIFIKYLKNKLYTDDFIKENVDKIKDLLKWLYIRIQYKIIFSNLYYHLTLEEQLEILDEYANIFNITYEKITY
jgi:hypothetical protein